MNSTHASNRQQCLAMIEDGTRCPRRARAVRLCREHYDMQQAFIAEGKTLVFAELQPRHGSHPHLRARDEGGRVVSAALYPYLPCWGTRSGESDLLSSESLYRSASRDCQQDHFTHSNSPTE